MFTAVHSSTITVTYTIDSGSDPLRQVSQTANSKGSIQDHATCYAITGDKSRATVQQHQLETCKNAGLFDGWQWYNNAALCGEY